MKTALKITTLLFFLSGITFFVAYQSGYIFADPEPSHDPFNNNEFTESQIDTIQSAGTKGKEDVEVRVKINQFDGSYVPETKEKVTASDEEKLRIYSSKSLVVSKTLPSPDDNYPYKPKFRAKPKSLSPTFLSSSKSAIIEVDTRRFFPEYKPPILGTPFMWPSLGDSLRKQR